MKRIEKRIEVEGRKVRLTNFIDEESICFEDCAYSFLSDAAMEQTLKYLRHTPRKYLLFQSSQVDGSPGMQACVYIGHPDKMPAFGMASVPNLHRAVNAVEEEFGLRMLRDLCAKVPGVMTLRLQPQRFEAASLLDFQKLAQKQSFQATSPIGPVKTLLLDLEDSTETLMAKLPGKTRQKIRHSSRARIEIRALNDERLMEACSRAMTASRERSGGNEGTYDFEAVFALVKNHPERVRVLGLFLNERPDNLLAYVVGFKNGARAEYSSAGSFSDPELRTIPFNYFLLWELIHWFRSVGCTKIDMGGISDGGPEDPLQGINRFKRSFTDVELETGREMVQVLRPFLYGVYQVLKWAREKMRSWKPSPIRMLAAYD